ncbi:FecR family protein [Chitinophaga japonensis]|nr:FecR family protein [Chitinophaga japonensis]
MLKESAEARRILSEIEEASTDAQWTAPPRKRFPLFIAAGAALLIIAGAGYFLYSYYGRAPVQWNTIKVASGQHQSVELADSTLVQLNAATTFRYPSHFAGNYREVYLDGEAFFNVAASPKRPFIVHTTRADIKVLGTRFNVRTYDSSFSAALVSGAVMIITPGGQVVKLQPGYMASLNTSSQQLLIASFSSDTLLTWKNGIHRFEKKTLKEVCSMAERVYGIRILVERNAPDTLHYSGVIDRRQPIETLMEDLACSAGEDYYFDREGRLHIK